MQQRRERWLVATTEYAGATAYTGGIGTHYAALVPALARQGVEIELAIFGHGPMAVPRDLPGVRPILIPRAGDDPPVRTLVGNARRVARLYASGRHDRIFVPEWTGLGSSLPASAPLLTNLATGVRLANEVSGLRVRDLPADRRRVTIVQARYEARQIRRSSGLIAISSAMERWTRAAFPGCPPVRVVRNCVDVDRVRRASRSAPPPGWPERDEPIVLFLGRAERRKGIIEAFDGFAILHERSPAARLVVAGAGGDPRFEPTRADLLERLPVTARERVTWLGHVGGESLHGAVRAASLVICPSRWEGFGNVAVEVKAVGTPLVVSSGSGFDDFCTDGEDCAMVRPGDGAHLGETMLRVLRDPGAARSRAAVAAAGLGRFHPDAVARDLLEAADDLLGPAAGRPGSVVR